MIEDPYLGNDFELLLINYKSKTNKLILLYDMYSEFTIMNIISHHLFMRWSLNKTYNDTALNYIVIYKWLYGFENINLQSLESWFKSRWLLSMQWQCLCYSFAQRKVKAMSIILSVSDYITSIQNVRLPRSSKT